MADPCDPGAMAEVIVLTGPPGAGKTTIAPLVAAHFDRAVVVQGDAFFDWIVEGFIEPWLPASDAQNRAAIGAISAAAARYRDAGFTVVVEGIIGPWMLNVVRAELGDDFVYAIVRPDEATCLARAQARVDPDALVDAGPIQQMYDAFSDLGDAERYVIDTNAMTAADAAAAVIAAGGVGAGS